MIRVSWRFYSKRVVNRVFWREGFCRYGYGRWELYWATLGMICCVGGVDELGMLMVNQRIGEDMFLKRFLLEHPHVWRGMAFCFTGSGQWISKSGGKKSEVTRPVLRVTVPRFDNSARIARYSKTLIGRCMNPQKQDMKILLFVLPRIWNVEGRVEGHDLGLGGFQFDFTMEEDITEVLKMEPFHFDYWMVSLVRWKPVLEPNYPSKQTFWVHVMDIPLQFWDIQTFQSIGEMLGQIQRPVDVAEERVKVELDGFKPLVFPMAVEFEEGVEIMVALRYEKLFGYCRVCSRLTHDQSKCPEVMTELKQNTEEEAFLGDGAHVRSYKVAVDHVNQINGERGDGLQNRAHMGRGGQRDKGKGIAVDKQGPYHQDRSYHPYKGKTPRNFGDGFIGRYVGHGARKYPSYSRGALQSNAGPQNNPNNSQKMLGDAPKGGMNLSPAGCMHPGSELGEDSTSKARKSLHFEGMDGEQALEAHKEDSTVLGNIILANFQGIDRQRAKSDEDKNLEEQDESSHPLDDANLMIDGVLLTDAELMMEDGDDLEDWEQGEIPDCPEDMEEEVLAMEDHKAERRRMLRSKLWRRLMRGL